MKDRYTRGVGIVFRRTICTPAQLEPNSDKVKLWPKHCVTEQKRESIRHE